MLKPVVMIAWTLLTSGAAFADTAGANDWASGYPRTYHRAPEIDPSGAMAGLTLLAGGLAVLRGRRPRK